MKIFVILVIAASSTARPTESNEKQTVSIAENDQQLILYLHNQMLYRHNKQPQQPLAWSDTLANFAKGQTANCQLGSSGTKEQGENLYRHNSPDSIRNCNTTCIIDSGIKRWFDDDDKRHLQDRLAILENAEGVGCGMSNCEKNQLLFVCRYSKKAQETIS